MVTLAGLEPATSPNPQPPPYPGQQGRSVPISFRLHDVSYLILEGSFKFPHLLDISFIELASAFARNRARNEIAAKKRIFHSEPSCSARMRRGGSRILLSCRHFCSKAKVRGQ